MSVRSIWVTDMKRVIITLMIAAFVLSLFSCGSGGGNEGSKTEEASEVSEVIGDEMKEYEAFTYSANSMMQLRKIVPVSDNCIATLTGYYYIGDGGGGTFYWDPECEEPADNGIIVKLNDCEKGRFIRVCEPNVRNVRWFGATGGGTSDDTKAIQAAIDSLPANGGTVYFPGGDYLVKNTIKIGDGNADDVRSSKNGIKLVGEGGGFGVWGTSVPTAIIFRGVDKNIIEINGLISDVSIEGFYINGSELAETCLYMKAVQALTLKDVVCAQFRKYGYYLAGGNGEANACSDCNFKSCNAICINDGTICLCLDGDENTSPNRNFVFNDCRFDIHTTNGSIATYIADSCDITFLRCHFAGYSDGSDRLVLDAKVNNFPYGLSFHDCSTGDLKIIEKDDHSIGACWFIGHGTYDNELIVEHPMIWGITDSGVPFGRFGKDE